MKLNTPLIIAAAAIIAALLVLLIVLVLRNVMQKRYERAIINYQNKLLSQEMEEVRHIYMTMRGWRHDYHNHMQSLKAYLAKNEIEEARDYLNDLENELDDIQLLFDTGNVNVDAILNAKVSLALKNEIQCDYKAVIPKEMIVSDIDLCVLIGNLIDNAVESCRNLPVSEQFMRLYIAPMKKQLYISVCNATNEVVRKIDEDYINEKMNQRKAVGKISTGRHEADEVKFLSGVFNGYYHVLEGLISPLEGVNPEDIKINQLINRIKDENIKEVILALTPSIEGDTTSLYILKMLEGLNVSVTKIASGIPMGADMEYMDPITIAKAMEGRNKIS